MERRKRDFALLFAAILLMIAGAEGIVFAADGTLEVASAAVTTSPDAISTPLQLNTSGAVTTSSAIVDVALDSNIDIVFNQAVATSGTKNKITLYALTNDGFVTGSAISYAGTISGAAFTLNPTVDLSADTYYKVTIGSGISSADSSVSTSSTYLGAFKTIAAVGPTPVTPTTFSAIMTNPANSGNVVSNAVNLNSAVFSFTFSEAVKNNGLNGSGIVTLTKVSGGSESVASSGAIVASAVSGGKITFTAMGTNGSMGTAFTIDPSVLEPSTTYTFTIKSTAAAVSGHTLGTDAAYNFTTSANTIAEPATAFEAIYLYPASLEKDVPVDSSLLIGFTNAVASSNKITNGKAVQLMDGATTVAAVYSLDSDGTTITIDPASNLAYGKEYTLAVLNGQLSNTSGTAISGSSITFKTTSFSNVTASAVSSGTGLTVTANLTNGSSSSQNVKIAYVVRRDKGARLEYGGTVVVKDLTAQTACTANGTTTITINLADITWNTFISSLSGTVYVDLYIVNSSGNLLYDPINIRAN